MRRAEADATGGKQMTSMPTAAKGQGNETIV